MKKLLLIISLVLFLTFRARAQNNSDLKIDTIDITQTSTDTASKFYSYVESKPEFPGGIQEFYKYLSQNLHISPNQLIKGKVIVTFDIGLKGDVEEPTIIKGILTEGAKKEIIRVFNESPKWKPGIQNNKPYKMQYTLPINFGN